MSNLKAMSMSELIMRHNELATQLGGPGVTEFKNLAAARAAVETLEKKMSEPQTASEGAAATVATSSDPTKYNSSGKRGPNQGVGAYAKELIAAGGDNKSILEAVKAKFPNAKTSTACIAYYRTAVKNGGSVKKKVTATPEELRAKAQALLDQAKATEDAAAAKAAEAAQASAEPAPV